MTAKRQFMGVYLLLVAITLAVYAQVHAFGFVTLDDNDYVTDNPHIRAPFFADGLRWAFTTGYISNWHPLTWLSYMLDYRLFGFNAGGYHVVNVLFHIMNTLLLFEALRRMTGNVWPSAFAAALFSAHPLHVESGAWISERKDVLSCSFWLMTLIAYHAYVERPAVRRYLLVVVVFALGLMAKSMLVTLPCVLLLLDYWPLGRWSKTGEGEKGKGGKGERESADPKIQNPKSKIGCLLLEKIPLFVLSAASSVITIAVQHGGGTMMPFEALPLRVRLMNAVIAYVSYIRKMFWPSDLAVFYPYFVSHVPAWRIVLAGGALAGLSLSALWMFRRRPYWGVGWFWYLGTLAPVIGIVQVGDQAMADRYTYIPLIGLFMAGAWGLLDLGARSRSLRLAATVAGIAACIAATLAGAFQAHYWRDSVTLFERALRVTKDNKVVENNMGIALAKLGRCDEAIRHYREALRINPYYSDAHHNLGVALFQQGEREEAMDHYLEALRMRPHDPTVLNNLGSAYAAQRDYAAAIGYYEEALRCDPGYVAAHLNLGNVLIQQRNPDAAIAHYLEAARIDPACGDAYFNLGAVMEAQGKKEEAIRYLRKAVELDPNDAKARERLDRVQTKSSQGKTP